MDNQQEVNYQRIAEAIEFIVTHFKEQPGLDEVAAAVHVSRAHFQRMFLEWAGTTPKKFLQFISLEYAKNILREKKFTLSDATFDTGLSSVSRLHDLFVTIEGMTPAEYKNGGADLLMNYSFKMSPFGKIFIASTEKGICHMSFDPDENKAISDLKAKFPRATFRHFSDENQVRLLSVFSGNEIDLPKIKLHLKGSPFQLKVWHSLLKIPTGKVTSYGDVANAIGSPKASRAVGSAIGQNPVAYLIPCHRVIQASGAIGGYMWGPGRKAAILGWETLQDQKNVEAEYRKTLPV